MRRRDSGDAWGPRWLRDLGQDLRYAVRGLVRHKGFAATAIATLALGIGANAAIFSVVSGVIFKPLPMVVPAFRASRMDPMAALRNE